MMDFTAVETLAFSFGTLVSFAYFMILGAYAIFSGVLYYHWNTYATDKKVSSLTLILYFVTTLPLIAIMSLMAFLL